MRTYFAIVGIAMLVFSAWLYWKRAVLVLHGILAQGRIDGFEPCITQDGTAYMPVVAFVDRHGHPRRFTARAGGASKPAVGTPVVVRYLPQDPDSACIQSFFQMWAAPLACALLGFGALLAVVL
ncbi:MAG: DUF3592 domain-containing protein [Variovorax sp.]|nr:DUF3592 domain-containing protein [Variovorax sp.]